MKKILLFLLICVFLFPLTVKASEENTIYFLGDSRFVGLQSFDNEENHIYIAKVSSGYSFLSENIEKIKGNLSEKDILIINSGVNDLGNKEKYVKLVNELSKNTQAKIYYLTINPVNESIAKNFGYTVSNEQIKNFNEYLEENIDEEIIIIHSFEILENNIDTSDGIHYNASTNKEILNIINEAIEEKEEIFDNKEIHDFVKLFNIKYKNNFLLQTK